MRIRKIRINDDDKNIFKNIVGAFIIRGLALAVTLISTPLYIKYFDNQQVLGLWFTILSVLSWILTFDLGIGNGLRNKLVYAVNQKDSVNVKKIVSSSYIMIGMIVLVFLIIGIPIVLSVNWNYIFNIEYADVSKNTLSLVILITFLSIAIQFFLRTVGYILYAIQKSAVNNFISLSISVLNVLGLLIVSRGNLEQNLINMSFIYFFAATMPYIISTIIVFLKPLKDAKPNFRFYDKVIAKDVVKLGLGIFYNQVIYMLLTSTNVILISSFYGSEYVVDHEIYHKIFYLVPVLFSLLLSPMLSAVTKMHATKDYVRLKNYFNICMMFGLLASLFQFIPALFLQTIFDVWLGSRTIDASLLYATMFAFFGTVFILQNIVSTFAIGLSKIKMQASMYTFALILKMLLVFTLKNRFDSWILIIAIDGFVLIPYILVEFFSTRKIVYSFSDTDKVKKIFYIAHYDLLDRENVRNVHPGAVKRMDYVVDSLKNLGYKVEIISLAVPSRPGKYKTEKIEIFEDINLKLFWSYYANNKFKKIIRKIYYILSILIYITFKIKKNELVVFYHAIGIDWIVKYCKKIKGNKIMLDVAELYGDYISDLALKKREIKLFLLANSYIFCNEYMQKTYSDNKPSTVLYGIYKAYEGSSDVKFEDGKTHIVYSGTLSSIKKGSSNAVKACLCLDENFHLHVLGISSEEEVNITKKLIEEVLSNTKCKITYDGTLYGNEYLNFLKKCHIGLSTQMVHNDLNATSFPSKILTYLSVGLNVVSSEVIAVRNSKLAEIIEFYDDDSPKSIADSILKKTTNLQDPREILKNLDEDFKKNLRITIDSTR